MSFSAPAKAEPSLTAPRKKWKDVLILLMVSYTCPAARRTTYSWDGSIRVWDLESGTQIEKLPLLLDTNKIELCFPSSTVTHIVRTELERAWCDVLFYGRHNTCEPLADVEHAPPENTRKLAVHNGL
ncbi:hypothetical protein EDB19DRAFT_2041892 [Suillus lakei]|nr:hypothetical protein EDB19DRAFT_2041892 [Suillus lakei]